MDANYNWTHVAHVVRDVFDSPKNVLYYGTDHGLIPALRTSEHGIEAWGLYSGRSDGEPKYVFNWLIGYNSCRFGFDFCDVFMSFDYTLTPDLFRQPEVVAFKVAQVVQPNGIAVFVNPGGGWADKMGTFMHNRLDLVRDMKRYQMFAGKDVRIYQR